MIFTFYKAQGLGVGASLVEEDKLELAKALMEKAKVGCRCGGSNVRWWWWWWCELMETARVRL